MPNENENIGFGGTVHVNDGASSAYVIVPNIVDFMPPAYKLGTVESKRLDLPGGVIVKIPTLTNGQSFTIKHNFTKAAFARFEALRTAKAAKNFRITLPDGSPYFTETVPGIVVENKKGSIESETIMTIETTVEVSGDLVTSGA